MDVRRVRPDEWRELKAARLRALEDFPDAFGGTLVESAARPDERWRDWASQGGSSDRNAVFVAVADGRIVGLCGSLLDPDEDGVAFVYSMWVEPQHRGGGLGRRLLAAATEWSEGLGVVELRLDVTEVNDAACRFYRRAGFVETGVTAPLASNPSLTTREMSRRLG